MWLLQFLRRYRSVDFISSIAGKVAHNCHQSTWRRVRHRVISMRLHEARGYVRARAVECVHSETDRMLANVRGITHEQRAAIVSRALEHVVGLVIRDVLTPSTSLAGKRLAA
jgi:hypothetical protein